MQSREEVKPHLQPNLVKGNDFFRNQFDRIIFFLILTIFIMLACVSVVLYQIYHRPLPEFIAISPTKERLGLIPSEEPNLLPNTLLKWASKAAVTAYTFDFVNYDTQIAAARHYFTDAGWNDYQNSIAPLISTITKNQLFVNGVVSGTPIISNQGDLPGVGYAWRVQMPFRVTYQSSETTRRTSYMVLLTIVRVPTWKTPDAIGIDQFIMQ